MCACVHVSVEGVVSILLEGGVMVNIRNRKNQLPRQLTHNINIVSRLVAAAAEQRQQEQPHQTETQRTGTARTTVASYRV